MRFETAAILCASGAVALFVAARLANFMARLFTPDSLTGGVRTVLAAS